MTNDKATDVTVKHPISALREMLAMDIAREGSLHSFMIRAGLLADLLDELKAHRTASEQPASGEDMRSRRAVNIELAELLAPFVPDLLDRMRIGNQACTRILAALSTTSEAPEAGRLREALEDIVSTWERNENKGDDWEDGYEDALSECARKARAALSPPCEGAE